MEATWLGKDCNLMLQESFPTQKKLNKLFSLFATIVDNKLVSLTQFSGMKGLFLFLEPKIAGAFSRQVDFFISSKHKKHLP